MKWKWIGHTLRKDSQAIQRVEEEIGKLGKIWKEDGALDQNRIGLRCFVEALCS
jgi:hypothetical protein